MIYCRIILFTNSRLQIAPTASTAGPLPAACLKTPGLDRPVLPLLLNPATLRHQAAAGNHCSAVPVLGSLGDLRRLCRVHGTAWLEIVALHFACGQASGVFHPISQTGARRDRVQQVQLPTRRMNRLVGTFRRDTCPPRGYRWVLYSYRPTCGTSPRTN